MLLGGSTKPTASWTWPRTVTAPGTTRPPWSRTGSCCSTPVPGGVRPARHAPGGSCWTSTPRCGGGRGQRGRRARRNGRGRRSRGVEAPGGAAPPGRGAQLPGALLGSGRRPGARRRVLRAGPGHEPGRIPLRLNHNRTCWPGTTSRAPRRAHHDPPGAVDGPGAGVTHGQRRPPRLGGGAPRREDARPAQGLRGRSADEARDRGLHAEALRAASLLMKEALDQRPHPGARRVHPGRDRAAGGTGPGGDRALPAGHDRSGDAAQARRTGPPGDRPVPRGRSQGGRGRRPLAERVTERIERGGHYEELVQVQDELKRGPGAGGAGDLVGSARRLEAFNRDHPRCLDGWLELAAWSAGSTASTGP